MAKETEISAALVSALHLSSRVVHCSLSGWHLRYLLRDAFFVDRMNGRVMLRCVIRQSVVCHLSVTFLYHVCCCVAIQPLWLILIIVSVVLSKNVKYTSLVSWLVLSARCYGNELQLGHGRCHVTTGAPCVVNNNNLLKSLSAEIVEQTDTQNSSRFDMCALCASIGETSTEYS